MLKSVTEPWEEYRSIFEATIDALAIADRNGIAVEVNPAFCEMYGYTRDVFLAMRYQVLPAEDLEELEAHGSIRRQTANCRSSGEWFHLEGRATTFAYKGRPHYLLVIRDVTERVQAYELLERRVEERTRELASLLDVSHAVASTLELKPLLDRILDGLLAVIPYDGAGIIELNQDSVGFLARRAPTPAEAGEGYAFREVPFRPMMDAVMRREAIIIDDIMGDSPMALAYRLHAPELLESQLSYIRAWMGVPLATKDRVMGLLVFASSTPGLYTERHVELAGAIGLQAAIAIENARLYERAQEAAALEERQRLARELHDSVTQALFSIGLGARTARMLLDRDVELAAKSIDDVISLTQGGMAEMRALIFELRPESLATEGIVAALQKQAEATTARYEIPVRATLCEEPEISLPAKEALYRIAQEALHNAVKHARPGSLDLRLTHTAAGVLLEIRDDGRGFDTAGEFPGHLGLHTMHERAARVGGTLEVESAPGDGTCVRAVIPVRA